MRDQTLDDIHQEYTIDRVIHDLKVGNNFLYDIKWHGYGAGSYTGASLKNILVHFA